MFGGSLFGGEDENATALGGDSTGDNYGSMGFGAMGQNGSAGAYEQSQAGWSNASGGSETDPAETAAQASMANVSNAPSAQDISQGIGKASGFFSSIYGMFDARAKRNRRAQRVYSRNEAAFRLAQSKRNLDQFNADSAIQQQKLQQSYSGRGLGQSSIETEGMQYFNDTTARQRESLQEQVSLANNYQTMIRSNISMSYANVWLSFGNSLTNMI